MARANNHSTTLRLSQMFADPFLRAAFGAAEDDGGAPMLVASDRPRALNGGAAEVAPVRTLEMA